jgi:hypothetical protein
MTERATVFEDAQIGPESLAAKGVAVAADTRLPAIGINMTPAITTRRFRPRGRKLDTLIVPGKKSTEGDIEGVATYQDPVYVLDSLLGTTTPTIPGGATLARERLWRIISSGPDNPQSYTVEAGSSVRAARATHVVFTEMSLELNSEEVNIGGALIGQRYVDGITRTADREEVQTVVQAGASAGDFTLTFEGQTTAAIAYNAAASVVQTRLEALSNVAPGDVTCAGGPLGTSGVTVTFENTGALLGDRTLMTANIAGLTGGTVTITETIKGIQISELEQVPVQPDDIVLYMDEAFEDIGTTVVDRLLSATLTIGDRYAPLWVVNRANASWVAIIETAPNITLEYVVEADADGMAYLTDMENGDTKFARLECLGPEIETGQNYLLQVDFVGAIDDLGGMDDEDGVWGVTWTLRALDDDDMVGIEVLMRNEIAAL